MTAKIFAKTLKIFQIALLLFLLPHSLIGEDKKPYECLEQAVKRVIEIRSLPENDLCVLWMGNTFY